MIFQCSDLDRALGSPDLLPDARAHAEQCRHCREQLALWAEIGRIAPSLHEDWESPALWPRIENELKKAPSARKPVPVWRWAMAAAAALILGIWMWPSRDQVQSQAFLTEEALRDVERTESAYAKSIEKLSAVTADSLDRSSLPLAAAYREKLMLLDSAIADLKANIETNRYNVYLQNQLASLYRDKQQTLQEWLNNAKRNSPSTPGVQHP